MNKINFHLIACALAFGWICRSWARERAPLKQVAATWLLVVVFGGILPVACEMAWTGADWSTWFYNVVQLPLSARGGRIELLFSSRLYLETLHNYYGEIRLPQIGLLAVLLPFVAAFAAWKTECKNGGRWAFVFVALAGVFAAAAGVALLLTNNEIAHLTLSAVVVMVVSLWLGFRIGNKGSLVRVWGARSSLASRRLRLGVGMERAALAVRSLDGTQIALCLRRASRF